MSQRIIITWFLAFFATSFLFANGSQPSFSYFHIQKAYHSKDYSALSLYGRKLEVLSSDSNTNYIQSLYAWLRDCEMLLEVEDQRAGPRKKLSHIQYIESGDSLIVFSRYLRSIKYLQLGEKRKALEQILKAKVLMENFSLTAWQPYLELSLVEIEKDLGKSSLAQKHLNELLSKVKATGSRQKLPLYMAYLLDIELALHKQAKLSISLDSLIRQGSPLWYQVSLLDLLSKSSHTPTNSPNQEEVFALKLNKEKELLKKEIREQDSALANFYAKENKIIENKALRERNKTQELKIKNKRIESQLLYFGIFVFVLLTAVAISAFLRVKMAHKKLLKLTKAIKDSRENIRATGEKLSNTNKKLVKMQAALLKQKKQAERANKAKDVFLSSISHELRTPLTAILGLTEEMYEEEPNREKRDQLEMIKYSGENLLNLVNDILDYNKIEAGRIELESVDFDLNDLCEKITKLLKPKARKNRVDVICDIQLGESQWLKGDPLRLSQVLNNLLSNAIKFTKDGKVELRAELRQEDKNFVWLDMAVEDDGIGIPEDKQEAIFKSFTQASISTSREYGGTGLGLAITKRILELHGSTLRLKSSPGKGSTFYFTLKLAKGEYKPDQGANTDGIVELPSDLNILLAEDNLINQKLVIKTFEREGIRIDLANDGEEAVTKVREKDYDLVLMDVHMPKMTGFEATKEIREMQGKYTYLPIIALSGSTEKEKHELEKAGLSAFVRKPFSRKELLQAIKEQLIHT